MCGVLIIDMVLKIFLHTMIHVYSFLFFIAMMHMREYDASIESEELWVRVYERLCFEMYVETRLGQ